ncbi:MAG: plastocyanin [Ilumatobacter sp.]|jgi:plastocyanin
MRTHSMRTHRFLLIAATSVLALTACSSSDDAADNSTVETAAGESAPATESPDTSATGGAVDITKSRFGPLELNVGVGDTVTFTNSDPFDHTVTSKDDAAQQFDSGNFGENETFEVEFAAAGIYAYFCQIHPTMRATVVVS